MRCFRDECLGLAKRGGEPADEAVQRPHQRNQFRRDRAGDRAQVAVYRAEAPRGAATIDPALAEELRQLGYIQDEEIDDQ